MRALLGGQQGVRAAEVLMDLHKAFELVDRGLLVAAARDADLLRHHAHGSWFGLQVFNSLYWFVHAVVLVPVRDFWRML